MRCKLRQIEFPDEFNRSGVIIPGHLLGYAKDAQTFLMAAERAAEEVVQKARIKAEIEAQNVADHALSTFGREFTELIQNINQRQVAQELKLVDACEQLLRKAFKILADEIVPSQRINVVLTHLVRAYQSDHGIPIRCSSLDLKMVQEQLRIVCEKNNCRSSVFKVEEDIECVQGRVYLEPSGGGVISCDFSVLLNLIGQCLGGDFQ